MHVVPAAASRHSDAAEMDAAASAGPPSPSQLGNGSRRTSAAQHAGVPDAAVVTEGQPSADAAPEADPELLKQQLQLIQLCFAEHEFGIVVDEDVHGSGRSSSGSSSDASPRSRSPSTCSQSDDDEGGGGGGGAGRRRGLPDFDALAFVSGKTQHGVPLAVLSQDLHAYARYIENRIAQCVNTDVHTAFVNVSGHLVGMKDELSYMERPLTAAMEKLSTAVGQIAATSTKVRQTVEAACAAEMERAFDAVYLRSMVVYETIAYQLDDLAALLHITVDTAATTAGARPAPAGGSGGGAGSGAASLTTRDGGDKSAAAPPKLTFLVAPDTQLSDAALDVLEDVVLLCLELREVCQRLGSLPSREQERAEAASNLAAAEQSVMAVLEVVLVHASQLAFGPPTDAAAAAAASPSPSPGALVARQLLGRVIELYGQAGEMEQFCVVFRNAVLRPPLEAVVSWKAATQARQSAEGTVALLRQMKAVLQTTFLPLLPLLREHYGAALHPTTTIVWPVLSETLVKKLPSLYEVGIPNHFQMRYKAAYELLAVVEGACADAEELAVLRRSPDVVLWNHKWNLDVYAALRVSEVDKALQSVSAPLDRLPPATQSDYHFRLFYIAQQQLLHLFSSSVFLLMCAPRFLRQTVACCHRVLERVQEAVAVAAGTPRPGSAVAEGVDRPASAAASDSGSAAAGDGAHDTLLLAIADAHTLRAFLEGQLRDVVLGRLAAESGQAPLEALQSATSTARVTGGAAAAAAERGTPELVADVLQFAGASVCGQFVHQARASLVRQVAEAAALPLQNLKSVRSAYSHTRKTMPSAASWYVTPAMQPLRQFAEEAQRSGFGGAVLQDSVAEMLSAVVGHFVALARETLITAKKTEESWEKLRRRKEGGVPTPATADQVPGASDEHNGGTAASVAAGGEQRVTLETATDRDKMTIQLWMDALAMQEAAQQPPLSLSAERTTEVFAGAMELLRRAEWIHGADIPEPPDVDA
ncbi:COG (conserved oligomeric Golgi) complex component [Novymonas esmeraldas]|uniref:Conserved oligomeric Golgi complex subunit 2 n=1 Tax=Novymonas esmeraldas TaxID=1808958 RepID=A0AAW0F8Q1_9TRYP